MSNVIHLKHDDAADAAARAAIKAKRQHEVDLFLLRGIFEAASPSAQRAFLDLVLATGTKSGHLSE